MSLVGRKPVFGLSDLCLTRSDTSQTLVRHKSDTKQPVQLLDDI